MTREEAIRVLYAIKDELMERHFSYKEHPSMPITAIDMAIEALSKPTDTDLISRADAIKGIRKCKFESDMPSDWYKGMEEAQSIIKSLPSAELPKGDLISRKVLMDRLESFCKWCKDGRLQGAEFVWDCIVPNVPSADVIHSGGVFVPNMEMPEACDYCLFHDSEWSWCKAKDKYCGDGKCPLIAVRGERREP